MGDSLGECVVGGGTMRRSLFPGTAVNISGDPDGAMIRCSYRNRSLLQELPLPRPGHWSRWRRVCG